VSGVTQRLQLAAPIRELPGLPCRKHGHLVVCVFGTPPRRVPSALSPESAWLKFFRRQRGVEQFADLNHDVIFVVVHPRVGTSVARTHGGHCLIT